MNIIIQFSKILMLCILTASLFSACNKEPEVIKHSPTACNKVSINITNKLDKTINDLSVDGVDIGDINAGDTIEDICLDDLLTDSGVYPYLTLIGNYLGQSTGQIMIVCGMGMVVVDNGVYSIEITSAENNFFYYNSI